MSLESFLRADVPLPAAQIDVEFGAPDRDWSARLTRPTLSIFLHEVRRSTSRSVTGTVTRQSSAGYAREQLAPFVRVRWCISLWTSEPSDEHRVLGDLLSLVVTTGGIPPEHLVAPLDALGNPVELALASEDVRSSADIWSGLGVAPRLAVELVGILPVAAPFVRAVPAPPGDVQLGVGDTGDGRRHSTTARTAAGSGTGARRLAGRHGSAVVEDLGRHLARDGGDD